MGFGAISQFIDNTSPVTPPFGELSTYSQTFVKEIGKYRSETAPGYFLMAFKSQDRETGQTIPLTQVQADLIIGVIRECVAYASTHSLPYDMDNFKISVVAAYPNAVQDLDFGPLVYHANIALPQFIIFHSNTLQMDVKVWLSDAAFRDQFTDNSITVVPILDNLNDFFKQYEDVVKMVGAVSTPMMIERMQKAKNDSPDTIIRVMEFNLVNRYNKTIKHKVMWGFLIYGPEGNNNDILKDKLADYLQKNSDYKEADWENIFPEIFQRTEFLIVPRWDRIATKNLTDMSSMYSQVNSLANQSAFVENFLAFYGNQAFVRNNTYTVNFAWRYLGTTITNGKKNEEGKTDWLAMFKDYIPTGVGPDMGRMSIPTQQWLYFINEVLRQAETATQVTQLPAGMRRVMRNDKLFISSNFDNVNYLVAAKWNQAFN